MKSNVNNRTLCWDDSLIEKSSNVEIRMHKMEKKNLALVCDSEWEGAYNCYGSLLNVDGVYRLYYRADASRLMAAGGIASSEVVICLAESTDGIVFRKPNLCKYEFNGTKNNNIVFSRPNRIDSFSVFYDKNPRCPACEKFKAFSSYKVDGNDRLMCYVSADGYDFKEKGFVGVKGTFDSFNTLVWDEDTEQYFLFYRAFHKADGRELFEWKDIDVVSDIRHVRVATSKDFENWTEHGRIKFKEGQQEYPLYTNQIEKYYRSSNTFIGFPVRYCDRVNEKDNFSFMALSDRRDSIAKKFGRSATALTDCIIMTSPDGFTFDKRDESFMTPGIEARNNWWYGDCYTVYGLAETASDEEGAPNEISMYVGENYAVKSVNFRRYTTRLDGFFSWYGSYSGGEVVTRSLKISGGSMKLNFASSAVGKIIVAICDTDGAALDGYTSYPIFGDSVDRPVVFEKDLSALSGKEVRLKLELYDSHLYSFTFE